MQWKSEIARFDLQAAIDRLPPEGGTVLIPPGVHHSMKGIRVSRPMVKFKCVRNGLTQISSEDATSPVIAVEARSCLIAGIQIVRVSTRQIAILLGPGSEGSKVRNVTILDRGGD
jgi:hypothetical protein